MKQNLSISIDTLRIDGFSRLDSMRVRDSFEAQIQQLASTGQLHQAIRAKQIQRIERDTLCLSPISITGKMSPQKIGRQAATNLWKAICHG